MISVEVPWTDQRYGATFSMEVSKWCEEQGLTKNVDYWWQFIPNKKVTVFFFSDKCESYATLFQLKWAGQNEI